MGTQPTGDHLDDYQVSLASDRQWFVMARPEIFGRQELGAWLRKRPFTELVRDSAGGFLVTMKPRSKRTPAAYAGVVRAELRRRCNAWMAAQTSDPSAELKHLQVATHGKAVWVTALDGRIDLPTLTSWLRGLDLTDSVHADGDLDSRTLRVRGSFHLTPEEFAARITEKLIEKEVEAEGQPPFQRRRIDVGASPQHCRVHTVGDQIHVTFDQATIDGEALRSNLADLTCVEGAQLRGSNVVVAPDPTYGLERVENTILRELPSIEPHVLLRPELPRVDGGAAQRLLEHLGRQPGPAARAEAAVRLMRGLLRDPDSGPALQALVDEVVEAVLDRMGPGEELDAVIERLSALLVQLQSFSAAGFTITITPKGKIKVKVAPSLTA